MARRAEVILDVQPKMSGLHAFEREAMASAQRIRQAMNEAIGGGGPNGSQERQKKPKGFIGSFFEGWGRAGGFGAAVATVIKYAAAYKMVEMGSRTAWAPIRAAGVAMTESTKAALEMTEAMTAAARTFRQPGLNVGWLQGMMSREALDFLGQYRVKIQDVAASMYELGSANFDVADILQAYETPLKVNLALQGDITQTTQLLTQMLKIHGDQMGDNMTTQEKMIRLGGVLYKTWEIEQVELSDLAASYKYVAGAASMLNIKAEELIPVLGTLATIGARGSIGGTSLNQFLTQAARNMRLTSDEAVRLEKAIRGGKHGVSLGIKAGDLTSPLQILIQMSKAFGQMPKNFSGRMEVAKIVSDMFNIRGARAALLLMENLSSAIENVGNMANSSTADLERMVDAAVELMQNTPTAQLDIMSNKLRVMGIDAFNAALGANTLTGALKELNAWIERNRGWLEGAATGIRRHFIGAGTTLKEINNPKGYIPDDRTPLGIWNLGVAAYKAGLGVTKGKRAADQDEFLRQMIGDIADQYRHDIKSGKTAEQAKKNAQWNLVNQRQLYRTKFGETAPLNQWDKIATTIEEQRQEAAQQKKIEDMRNALINGTPEAGYDFKDSGGGGSVKDASSEFRKQLEQITSGMEGYKRATLEVSTALDLVEIQEQRLSRLMNDRYITSGLIAEAEAKAGEKMILQRNLMSSLMKEVEELNKQRQQILDAAKRAPDEDSARDARSKAFGIYTEIMQKQVDIARAAEGVNVAGEIPAAVRFLKFQQNFKFEAEQFERSMRTYREALEIPADALRALEIEERLFGQTTQTAASRVDVLTDSIMRLSSAREKSEAEAVNMRYTYESLATIRDALGRGEGLTEAQLAHLQKVWSPEQIAAAQQSGQLYSWVGEALSGYASRADEARRATKDFSDQIADQNAQLIEAQRVILTLGTDRAFEDFESRLETAQAVLGARGIDWETSAERATFLAERIDLLVQKLGALDAQYAAGTLSAEAYMRDQQKILRELYITGAQGVQLDDARKSVELDYRKRMLETRASWIQGGGAEAVQRQIAVNRKMLQYEMEVLRKQYPDPWAEGMLKEYEQVMEKNIIVQPWLEARDQIQQEWTQMFSDLYTGLVSGGTNPWKAFVESIIGSVQGRIMQMLVQKYLAPLFDFMASAQTGISIAEAKAIEADASAQVSVALTELTVAAQAATAALTEATTAMSGGGTGGGISRTQMILGAMAAAGGSAGGGGSMPSVMGMPGGGWGKGVGGFLGTAFQVYGAGSLYGGLLGGMLGKDPADSSKKAGIGGLIGYAIGGPVGGIVGGLLGGLFGKKKEAPKQEDSIDRMLYGMPAFEYESYLYNLTKKSPNKSHAYGSIYSKIVRDHASGYRPAGAGSSGETFIQININGGNIDQVKKVVDDALARNFGPVASIKVATSV